MPEGPTVHRIARDQTELFVGQTLTVTSPQGRFAAGAKVLSGRKLEGVGAVGKHLFYQFTGGRILHVHLGLYGKFRVQPVPGEAPRGAVRVRLVGKGEVVDLNGPTQCEVIDAGERQLILERLGADPLDPNADPEKSWERISGSKQSIGQLLMDQSVISGIGNIYRAELLWAAKLHPRSAGKALTRKDFDLLWDTSVEWMELAVKVGRIITTEKKSWPKPAARLTRDERFNIYKQKHCPRCGEKIEIYPLAGRKVYACGGCQRVKKAEG